jgi:RNA polymerase sigma-70 factor (ECF subfamily)
VDDELRAAVLAALDTLPPDQKAALVLVDMEGYSVQETAQILDCAPGTVKSRCSRGRARLLPLLAEHRPTSDAAGPVGTGTTPRASEHPSGASVPLPAEEVNTGDT